VKIPLPFRRIHGILRGLEGTGQSSQFEGRFGRMSRTLPPASFSENDTKTSEEVLKDLARYMVAEVELPDQQTKAGQRTLRKMLQSDLLPRFKGDPRMTRVPRRRFGLSGHE